MKVGDLARRTGISVRMLRYYETEGMLSPARRDSGYRDYSAADADIVERIKLLNAAGLTLPVIRELMPCLRNDRSSFEPCDELQRVLRREIDAMNAKIERLAGSRDMLLAFHENLERDRNHQPIAT
ncbi:MerR family transcriptional regulator [Brevundimonas fontaquae]|uniref:MerR family transcriptional regulator n=1 Tax=Brevundimonas fontaquae TaxID=2813778 RepID=A0ABX7LTU2_9CAUL|nr:MerR family transcriptional regulator [Brevundimonas fontaquae]QSF54801.1 MerR family transcriptional regulator [Brevundimonas fontaquae]